MPVFCPLASGSSGNCIFAANGNTRVLFDAGMSGKKIQAGLRQIKIEPESIDAIIITHEHGDHILGAGVMARRYGIPLYATALTWETMEREKILGPVSPDKCFSLNYGKKYTLGDLQIKPFKISHDAAEPAGYSIFASGYKISIATDLGLATDDLKENLSDSDILLLESNHDVDMLKNGPYPEYLKKRILSKHGHLSNKDCADAAVLLAASGVRHIILAHRLMPIPSFRSPRF